MIDNGKPGSIEDSLLGLSRKIDDLLISMKWDGDPLLEDFDARVSGRVLNEGELEITIQVKRVNRPLNDVG